MKMAENLKYMLIILCLFLVDINTNAQTIIEQETKAVEEIPIRSGIEKKTKAIRSQPQKAFTASLLLPGLRQA